jgi:hypothetical protein
MPSIANWPAGWTPTRADLDATTARTATVMASDASPAVRQAAAALEEAVTVAYLKQPGADAELQAEAELEACA